MYLLSLIHFFQFFPSHGAKSAVYIGPVDYFDEQLNLHKLYSRMQDESSIQPSSLVSWYDHYVTYMKNDPQKASYITQGTRTYPVCKIAGKSVCRSVLNIRSDLCTNVC